MTSRSVMALVVVAVGSLAGCSDDGGTSNGPRPTYEALLAENDALRADAFELPSTDPATLPTSGAATYDGVMTLDLFGKVVEGEEPRLLVGDLGMEVDFGRSTDAVSGSASDFVNYDGQQFDGSLEITDGSLSRGEIGSPDAPATIEAPIDGTLTDESGGDYVFAGDMAGYFRGTEPDYAYGIVGGTVTTPDGEDSFSGDFVGER